MYGQPCGAQRLSAVTPLFQYIPCRKKRCRKPPGLVFFSVRTAASRVPFFCFCVFCCLPKAQMRLFLRIAFRRGTAVKMAFPQLVFCFFLLFFLFYFSFLFLFFFFTAYFFFCLSDSQQHTQRCHGQKDAVPCPFQLQKE